MNIVIKIRGNDSNQSNEISIDLDLSSLRQQMGSRLTIEDVNVRVSEVDFPQNQESYIHTECIEEGPNTQESSPLETMSIEASNAHSTDGIKRKKAESLCCRCPESVLSFLLAGVVAFVLGACVRFTGITFGSLAYDAIVAVSACFLLLLLSFLTVEALGKTTAVSKFYTRLGQII